MEHGSFLLFHFSTIESPLCSIVEEWNEGLCLLFHVPKISCFGFCPNFIATRKLFLWDYATHLGVINNIVFWPRVYSPVLQVWKLLFLFLFFFLDLCSFTYFVSNNVNSCIPYWNLWIHTFSTESCEFTHFVLIHVSSHILHWIMWINVFCIEICEVTLILWIFTFSHILILNLAY